MDRKSFLEGLAWTGVAAAASTFGIPLPTSPSDRAYADKRWLLNRSRSRLPATLNPHDGPWAFLSTMGTTDPLFNNPKDNSGLVRTHISELIAQRAQPARPARAGSFLESYFQRAETGLRSYFPEREFGLPPTQAVVDTAIVLLATCFQPKITNREVAQRFGISDLSFTKKPDVQFIENLTDQVPPVLPIDRQSFIGNSTAYTQTGQGTDRFWHLLGHISLNTLLDRVKTDSGSFFYQTPLILNLIFYFAAPTKFVGETWEIKEDAEAVSEFANPFSKNFGHLTKTGHFDSEVPEDRIANGIGETAAKLLIAGKIKDAVNYLNQDAINLPHQKGDALTISTPLDLAKN